MIPERYSDEWFETMYDWEAKNHRILEEFHALIEYRDVQGKLKEFSEEVQHRIYSGA